MLTDRAPFEYLYLSRRLLTDLFQHDEAASSKWRASGDINLRIFGLHLSRRGPNLANLRDLAARSSALVADQTGTVADPGYYIAGELDAHDGLFAPLMGWRGSIACYRMETPVAGRRALVALFGSASNVVGRKAGDEASDFYPSDATGLYALLDAAREEGDRDIDLDYRWDDAGMSEQARAETAVMFARRGGTRPIGRVQFLARVFQTTDDTDRLQDRGFDRVIVGAPLWVASPMPRPFVPDDGQRDS